jgi:hypothetical protein
VTNRPTQEEPVAVPARAKQAGEAKSRWSWVEAGVWTARMLTALEAGVKGGRWFSPSTLAHCLFSTAGAVLTGYRPCLSLSIPPWRVTHQLESRMRETRLSGSEGGGAEANRLFLPLF